MVEVFAEGGGDVDGVGAVEAADLGGEGLELFGGGALGVDEQRPVTAEFGQGTAGSAKGLSADVDAELLGEVR